MNLRFDNPWMLYLLWLVPLLGLWFYAVSRRAEARLAGFVSAQMQSRLRPASSRTRAAWQGALLACAVLFALVALARPQWGMREEAVFQRGRDLMIALDVSRSMYANDVHPNRLQRAKADVMDLLKELHGDRAGLIAFRRRARLLCPLTTDYSYFVHALDSADLSSAPPGSTDIGAAIVVALQSFDDTEASHKAIVLISDGEDLTGRARAAARHAMTNGIPVFTVGIGSRRGSRIPEEPGAGVPYMKYQGNEVMTRLDDSTLESIARITGGAYIPIGTAGTTTTTLGTLYRDYLKNIADQDLQETLQRRHVERYQAFLLPAFILMTACGLLSRGRLAGGKRRKQEAKRPQRKRRTSKAKKVAVHASVAVLLLSSVCANAETNALPTSPISHHPLAINHSSSPGREVAREAQKLYGAGKYREAAEAYILALKGSTDELQHDFRYNAAVALFKAGDYGEAAEMLSDVARSSGPHRTAAASALGAALHQEAEITGEPNVTNLAGRADLLTRSAAAFRDAARGDPDDDQSLRNLQVVLNALPEAKEQAKTARLMQRYGQEPAPGLAMEMLKQQRALIEQMSDAFTNSTPSRIEQLEALAEAQRATADMWIPLKQKMLTATQGMTNRQAAAAVEQTMEGSRDAMLNAAENLRNLDPNGYRSALASEALTYGLWKGIAPFGLILQEDLLRQTNAVMLNTPGHKHPPTPYYSPRLHQDEALALTKLFTDRFSRAVPKEGTPPVATRPGVNDQAKTGEEQQGISAETRAEILRLADQAVAAQATASDLLKGATPVAAIPKQQESLRLLKEIEKLLPKQKQEQKNEQQQDKQNDRQDEQKQDQDKPPPEKKKEPEPKQEDVTPDEVKRLLQKAMERENEHEDRLKRLKRKEHRVPFEQDW